MIDDQEPKRPDPDFVIYIHHNLDETVDITHAVMDVYDIAINSMDFGSGFLSTEEVGNLRTLGKAIGAERFDYQHDKCLRCGHDMERHHDRAKVCGGAGFDPPGLPYFENPPAGKQVSQPICKCTGFIRPEQ